VTHATRGSSSEQRAFDAIDKGGAHARIKRATLILPRHNTSKTTAERENVIGFHPLFITSAIMRILAAVLLEWLIKKV
jgi:hypothetical protein